MKQPQKLTLPWLRFLLPLLLFLVFTALTLPGIAWGVPGAWNPDELVDKVDWAIVEGNYSYFDLENFDYPSLPKYVMLAVGKGVYALGYGRSEFIIAARLLSVLLGGCVVVLTYALAGRLGASTWAAFLSGLLLAAASVLAHNARFAHNDLYLLFFTTLTLHAALSYRLSASRLWLYAVFLGVGLAASSKYNGIVLVLLPVILYLWSRKKNLFADWLGSLETLSLGMAFTALGYVLGTPRAMLWMSFYFKRMIPAFMRHAVFGRQEDAVVGLLGQWGVLAQAIGLPLLAFFLLAAAWYAWKVLGAVFQRKSLDGERLHRVAVVLLALLILDLPLWFSYNYPARFFLPLLPPLAALAGLLIQEFASHEKLLNRRWFRPALTLTGVVVVGYSLLRVMSVTLLFLNDPRIPASQFLHTLPVGGSIEYTLYPPIIPEANFTYVHHYPIQIYKSIAQKPLETSLDFNLGEAGLLARQVDYLVADSLTYARFSDPFLCENNTTECAFFEQLIAGETQYEQIAYFPQYSLPFYLPQLRIDFVNPEIRVYQRQE
jgi:4-amino-4-deoxy-L-arabinose transferase-like glycosyltransferase